MSLHVALLKARVITPERLCQRFNNTLRLMQLVPLPGVIGGYEQCLCETEGKKKTFLCGELVPQSALFNKRPTEVMCCVLYCPPP